MEAGNLPLPHPEQLDSSSPNVPLGKGWIATPEQHGQEDHEEGVRAQIGRDGEVAVERRGAQLALERSEIRRLPANERKRLLSQVISPFWQRPFIYR